MKKIYDKIIESDLPSEGTYKAELIDNLLHRIGVDSFGHLSLFIKVDCAPDEKKPSIQSKFITVLFNVPCQINSDNLIGIEHYTVITLNSTLTSLVDYFIKIFSDFISRQESYLNLDALQSRLNSLFNLFSEKKRISKEIIQGLFAELLIIKNSERKDILIAAWHNNKSSIYDFNYENLFIEVKSSTRTERIHRFSHSQLQFLKHNESIVASFLIIESDLGVTAIDLTNNIREKLSNYEAREKLDKVVIQTIGSDWELADEFRFDINYALNSLRYFNAANIPAISPIAIPVELSEIKYSVSFEEITPNESIII